MCASPNVPGLYIGLENKRGLDCVRQYYIYIYIIIYIIYYN